MLQALRVETGFDDKSLSYMAAKETRNPWRMNSWSWPRMIRIGVPRTAVRASSRVCPRSTWFRTLDMEAQEASREIARAKAVHRDGIRERTLDSKQHCTVVGPLPEYVRENECLEEFIRANIALPSPTRG